jgi:hypothetical protein
VSDLDHPWKDVLDALLEAFLAFFFPTIHAAIDWSRPYEALDKELQQLLSESELGLRVADKLFKVWLQDGQEAWILIHVEIQNQRDPQFAKRMFTYNYRIYDRYDRPVLSLAVLGDEERHWRPDHFEYGMFGCRTGIAFRIAKLCDYAGQVAALEGSPNPFAAVVLAHVKTQETRSDPPSRRAWKFRLITSLYDRGWDGEQVRRLIKFLDWLMELPAELEEELSVELAEFEEERTMPYVSPMERIWEEKGRAKGRIEGEIKAKVEDLLELLALRYKTDVPAELEDHIRATADRAQLDAWFRVGVEASDLAEFRRLSRI